MASTLRCLRVLELMAEDPFELTVSRVAELLDTPRASAHRLCSTLQEAGLIENETATKRYRLTPKALWIGSGFLRHSALYRAAFFPMQKLSHDLPGTVQLGVLLEQSVVFIYSVGSAGATEAFADVGLRRPLHATASGKLFLAQMPAPQLEKILSGGLQKFTRNTRVSLSNIRQEFKSIAARGFAVNDEELLPGYFVLAAPVLNAGGRCVAAISLTILKKNLRRADETRFAAALISAARTTSIQLGYRPHAVKDA